MRFSLMCMACLVALSTLQLAVADQPSGHADADARSAISKLNVTVEKLSSRIQALEKAMQRQQQPEIAQAAFVPSPEKADKPRQVTIAYKVADLVRVQGDFATAYRFPPLIHDITSKIAPEQWEANGGSGKIVPHLEKGSLIISTTDQVHEHIKERLAELREAQELLAAAREAMHDAKEILSVLETTDY